MKFDKKLAQAVSALSYRDEWKLLMEHFNYRLEKVRDGLETDTKPEDLFHKQGRALELKYLTTLEARASAVISSTNDPNEL